MKKIFLFIAIAITIFIVSCQNSDFANSYSDPSKVANTTVEKQFTGFLVSNKDYVLPSYWNYFVVLRTTVTHYTQAVGWTNYPNQYLPGGGGVSDRWNNYYNFLTQFRELEKKYNSLSVADKGDSRIYMIAATIYLYDHTQKVIDLHGDIPFLNAGMLSMNNGDYQKSFAKYDNAAALYTKMLDDLKAFSNELNAITIPTYISNNFKTQDIVNRGNLDLWKKYCNSLRLRMLTRVSDEPTFKTRSGNEISAIISNSNNYVSNNTENIQINVFTITDTPPISLNSNGFQDGFESWNGNLAGKVMIDYMNTNTDPRIKVLFEPGQNANGIYEGINPMQLSSDQDAIIASGKTAIYNRSTLSRNKFFPGILINAPEVSFLIAEYYLKMGNTPAAKVAYETGIKQSIEYYSLLRSLSTDKIAGIYTPPTDLQVQAYLSGINVNWDLALTITEKLKLIATQKWLHFNVVQPLENWAEIRRLKFPQLNFSTDTNPQNKPPYRWNYPSSEATYNTENYNAVKSKDNLTTKIFWDVN